MALRLAARTALRHLRRGVPPAPRVPERPPPPPLPAGLGLQWLGRPPGAAGWARWSSKSPALRPPSKVAAFAARAVPSPRPQGFKLLKAFGMSTTLAMALYSQKAALAAGVEPADALFKDKDSKEPLVLSKHERRRLWSLVTKYNLPVGIIILTALGWQNPLGLLLHILLLLYSSRPNTYSIYLFLQELRQREIRQNPVFWREKCSPARKVDAEDYKLFTVGTVELEDRTVLHLIGILGSWWIYRVSCRQNSTASNQYSGRLVDMFHSEDYNSNF